MLEASFTDMRHGGDGDLRRAYILAQKVSTVQLILRNGLCTDNFTQRKILQPTSTTRTEQPNRAISLSRTAG